MFIHKLYHLGFKQFSTNSPIIRRFPVFLHLKTEVNDEEFC